MQLRDAEALPFFLTKLTARDPRPGEDSEMPMRIGSDFIESFLESAVDSVTIPIFLRSSARTAALRLQG
jgi:cobalamin biosynthesis protein CobD/CbiB